MGFLSRLPVAETGWCQPLIPVSIYIYYIHIYLSIFKRLCFFHRQFDDIWLVIRNIRCIIILCNAILRELICFNVTLKVLSQTRSHLSDYGGNGLYLDFAINGDIVLAHQTCLFTEYLRFGVFRGFLCSFREISIEIFWIIMIYPPENQDGPQKN